MVYINGLMLSFLECNEAAVEQQSKNFPLQG
jgi:hypothetical protein